MSRAVSKTNSSQNDDFKIRWIFYCCISILAMLAMISYSPEDISIIRSGSANAPANWIGNTGAFFSCYLLLFTGLAAYLAVGLCLLRSFRLLFRNDPGSTKSFLLALAMIVLGAMLLLAINPKDTIHLAEAVNLGRNGAVRDRAIPGGVIGQFLAGPPTLEASAGILWRLFGKIGVILCSLALIAAGLIVNFLADWHDLLKTYIFAGKPGEKTGKKVLETLATLASRRKSSAAEAEELDDEPDTSDDLPYDQDDEYTKSLSAISGKPKGNTLLGRLLNNPGEDEEDEEDADGDEVDFVPGRGVDEDDDQDFEDKDDFNDFKLPGTRQHTVLAASTAIPRVGTHVIQAGEKLRGEYGDYVLPPVTMLAKGVDVVGESDAAIQLAQRRLQETLDSFSVPGKVSGYVSGPRVTRFEITLEPGINVKKIEQIADNIAMNLAAQSVRILAPIPGRTVVGVEVSNSKPEAVHMRSIMECDAWRNTKAEIPIALGKSVSGDPVIMDLAKAPHMLVAGATGTGKSVCSNSLIISLIFRFRPDELRLIMVDPKIVEFDAYKKLPHLLTPIINDSNKVPIALRWAANEMDKRYRILAKVGVKKLSEFNNRPRPAEPEFDDDGKPIPDKIPLLVIILDELADLMMTEAKKDVETNITRIAQKGRAAGIHIIVATQRPSTNIITGVIKANLPTRLCFQVRALVDSRVVLDTPGAEKLLGMGDMLFMSSASMNIERVQGAWVKDDDIKSIVKFVSDQAPQRFNDNVLVDTENVDDDEPDDNFDESDDFDSFTDGRQSVAATVKKYMRPGDDDTMRRALEVIFVDQKASTSYLQRRLKIGYNRAAELMDIMEERGIIGPPSGSGNKRNILVFTDYPEGE